MAKAKKQPPAEAEARTPERFRQPRSGGFDVVLGNPPWERVKLQEKEWFAERVPEIANAPNAAARTRLIKSLEFDRPELYRQFLADVRAAEAASAFLRGSGRYPLCGRGDVNLYTVFAESMRESVSAIGRVGCIVPSGIATDDTTKFFFQDLIDRASLVSLFDFENREGLFEAVDSRMKFACLTLRAPATSAAAVAAASPAEFVFFAHRVEDLADDRRRFTLSRDEIALVNPNTRTCPIFRSKVDAELTKFIYRRVPVLVDETKPDGNPWGVEFSRLFDMSNDSGLFRTREQLEGEGWTLRGNVFERGEERYLPCMEGKMADHWNHRAASIKFVPDNPTRQQQPEDHAETDWSRPTMSALPFQWASEVHVRDRLRDWPYTWLPTFKRVTSATNERTFVPVVVPAHAISYTLYGISVKGPRLDRLLLLLANFGTFVADSFVRQKTAQPSLPMGVVYECAFACLRSDATNLLLLSHPEVAARVLELSATADDMAPFSRDLWPEGDGAVFRYDPARRFEIRCELDAAFFHLYLGTLDEWRRTASPALLAALPTPRDAVAYIMDSFPIVRRKDEEAHGRYRTKERILELYDRLADCLATGCPFTSSLTPPPGPPTNPDGTFAPLPKWPKGKPTPDGWPEHVHPPVSHRN